MRTRYFIAFLIIWQVLTYVMIIRGMKKYGKRFPAAIPVNNALPLLIVLTIFLWPHYLTTGVGYFLITLQWILFICSVVNPLCLAAVMVQERKEQREPKKTNPAYIASVHGFSVSCVILCRMLLEITNKNAPYAASCIALPVTFTKREEGDSLVSIFDEQNTDLRKEGR